jgi:malate dehydrogenase (oxaloacetate-decarboxylating)
MEKFPTVAGDLMSSPLITIDGNSTVRDLSFLMINKNIGSLIITIEGEPVGIVTEKDIIEKVAAFCKDPCITRTREIMSCPIITIEKNAGILATIRKMRNESVSRLTVTSDNKLIGIISEKYILRGISLASLTSFSSLLRT